MGTFSNRLAERAVAEHKRFGGRPETDARVRSLLVEYWTKGAARSAGDADAAIKAGLAWSAAFVSYCVRQTDAAAPFAFSSLHAKYIQAAIKNRQAGGAAPGFFGDPPSGPGARSPAVGDIIGFSRADDVKTYADAASRDDYFSHCDIVVARHGNVISVIGGNVGDTVTKATIALDAKGLLPAKSAAGGPYIVVLTNTLA